MRRSGYQSIQSMPEQSRLQSMQPLAVQVQRILDDAEDKEFDDEEAKFRLELRCDGQEVTSSQDKCGNFGECLAVQVFSCKPS